MVPILIQSRLPTRKAPSGNLEGSGGEASVEIPRINIGTRQQGRERGANTLDVPYERSAILAAIQRAVKGGRCKPDPLPERVR